MSEEVAETPTEETVQDNAPAASSEEQAPAGKFKTLEDAERSYNEQRSYVDKLKAEIPKAPDSYSFDLSEDPDFDKFKNDENVKLNLAEDPLVQSVEPILKKHNISQEAAADLVKAYVGYELEGYTDPIQEMAKLGENSDKIISETNVWLERTFTEDERTRLASMTSDAAGIQILNKLANQSLSQNIPTEDADIHVVTSKELYQKAKEIRDNSKNMDWDTEAQRDYDKLMQKGIALEKKEKSAKA